MSLTPDLAAALAWLDARLALQIAEVRLRRGTTADDEFRGLYVSDADADAALAPADLRGRPELAALRARAAGARGAYERALADRHGRLARLQALFGLAGLERDALALCLAPELDLRYERLFAYAQDDVTRKRPTVDLALRLLCDDPADRLRARPHFAPDAPLRRGMLLLAYQEGQPHAPLLAQFLKVDERIVAELLAEPGADPALHGAVRPVTDGRTLDGLVLPPEPVARLRSLCAAGRRGGLVVGLVGEYGAGRRAVAAAICAEAGLPLLVADAPRLAALDLSAEEAAARVLREARLGGAALLLAGAGAFLRDEQSRSVGAAWLDALDAHDGLAFLALDEPWEPRGALRRAAYACVALPAPSYADRERLWRARLNGATPVAGTVETLAAGFRLTPGQIRDAAAAAVGFATARGAGVAPADLLAGARAQGGASLGQLARHVVTPYGWDDIVLPADQADTLREIAATLRHRPTVYERWGFGEHLAGGKGLVVLFAGPSGTGKTMAASIIARDLGLDLYAIDLAGVVSKYIGETEKNLGRIFAAARQSNAVLLFDEADAVFGKRSEVKDAHDRYANIEVGYLLQQIEAYEGVVVLATNLRKNMDDAFVRRLHYAIEFPLPEEEDRLRIWRRSFPPAAPLDDDLDLPFAARQLRLAGGNIRNIALAAAFLAADERAPIAMRHLVRAARREYQKLGKLVTAADFGPYLALVRG